MMAEPAVFVLLLFMAGKLYYWPPCFDVRLPLLSAFFHGGHKPLRVKDTYG